MDRNITENHLIQYFFKECDAEIREYITANLSSRADWSEYLISLREIHSETKSLSTPKPSQTSINIILEESLHQEDHSY